MRKHKEDTMDLISSVNWLHSLRESLQEGGPPPIPKKALVGGGKKTKKGGAQPPPTPSSDDTKSALATMHRHITQTIAQKKKEKGLGLSSKQSLVKGRADRPSSGPLPGVNPQKPKTGMLRKIVGLKDGRSYFGLVVAECRLALYPS